MRNFIALIMLSLVMLFAMPQQNYAFSPPSDQVSFVYDVGHVAMDAVKTVSTVATQFENLVQLQTDIVDELAPPEAGLTDVINIPNKDATTADWIYWALGAFVFLFYNFIARLIPTAKSWTTAAIAYRFSNLFLKDRATGGGVLKIKKVG